MSTKECFLSPVRREVFETIVSSTTFGFGLCLDAWQTLGVLFSYLNSVALALMLAGVLYKVVRQDVQHKFRYREIRML